MGERKCKKLKENNEEEIIFGVFTAVDHVTSLNAWIDSWIDSIDLKSIKWPLRHFFSLST